MSFLICFQRAENVPPPPSKANPKLYPIATPLIRSSSLISPSSCMDPASRRPRPKVLPLSVSTLPVLAGSFTLNQVLKLTAIVQCLKGIFLPTRVGTLTFLHEPAAPSLELGGSSFPRGLVLDRPRPTSLYLPPSLTTNTENTLHAIIFLLPQLCDFPSITVKFSPYRCVLFRACLPPPAINPLDGTPSASRD